MFAAALCCAAGPGAHARDKAPHGAPPDLLVLCHTPTPHPPFWVAEGRGTVPDRIRAAAAPLGIRVKFTARPNPRCLQEIRDGVAAGHPAAPATPALQSEFAFPPLAPGAPQLGVTMRNRIRLFRRSEQAIAWDGRQLGGLQQPALIYSGAALPRQRLRELGVAIDESAQNLEQLFRKLLAGRGDVAAGYENDGAILLAQPDFAGRISMLEPPLVEADYYLMVSPAYLARHRPQVEALWRALAQQRK